MIQEQELCDWTGYNDPSSPTGCVPRELGIIQHLLDSRLSLMQVTIQLPTNIYLAWLSLRQVRIMA